MPRPPPLTPSHRLFYSLDFGRSRLFSAFLGHLRALLKINIFLPVHLVHQSVNLAATCASLCNHINPYHHIRQYIVEAVSVASVEDDMQCMKSEMQSSVIDHRKRNTWQKLRETTGGTFIKQVPVTILCNYTINNKDNRRIKTQIHISLVLLNNTTHSGTTNESSHINPTNDQINDQRRTSKQMGYST